MFASEALLTGSLAAGGGVHYIRIVDSDHRSIYLDLQIDKILPRQPYGVLTA
jgi:hypothetical protein